MLQQRIVCAAMRREGDGLIICGARHYDTLMRSMINETGGRIVWWNCEQGFIDNFGRFLNREQALEVAKETGQIIRACGGDSKELFSENLY